MPILHKQRKPEPEAAHLIVGKCGEQLAARWLQDHGYMIKERHYLRKWGEIDVIAIKGGVVHFVEVKSVSYGTRADLMFSVPRETFRPEENVHLRKLARLRRAIETWVMEQNYKGEYQLDVVTVRMVPRERFAVVDVIENVAE